MSTQAILHCLPLLADILGRTYGVTVAIGGTEAFTTGKAIQLPSLPASSDPTFLGVVRGYIDHEAAHIRHTDFDLLAQTALTPLEKHIWNIFEDWRVENKMATRFPGCRQNFDWLIRHLFRQRPACSRRSVYAVLDWLLLMVRGWSVPELLPQCQCQGELLDQLWPGLRARLEDILSGMRGHCPDSQACLDYARHVVACLKNNSDKNRQKPTKTFGRATTLSFPATGSTGDAPALSGEPQGHANAAQPPHGGRPEAPSATLAASTALQDLIDAPETDLPEDVREILRRSMGEGSGPSHRHAVAVVGDKRLRPVTAPERQEIGQVTAGLKARLLGLLQARRLVRYAPSRKGRLDPHRLHGIAIGKPQVFLAYRQKAALNTAVHLLLDSSGSMRERIGLASQCCHAVLQALSQAGVSVGLTAFPGTSSAATVVPLVRHGERVRGPVVVEAGGQTPLSEALWWVFQRLVPLREERKILLLVTDGDPDQPRAAQEAIAMGRALGIEIFGLGIDAMQIRQLLPDSSETIRTLPELPAALFALLQRALFPQTERISL